LLINVHRGTDMTFKIVVCVYKCFEKLWPKF
jgi:hypothetical protein